MKNMIFLILFGVFCMSSNAFASTEISISVDGKDAVLTEKAFIKNDYTMMLAEDIENVLDIIIDWDAKTGKIEVCRDSKENSNPNSIIVYTMQKNELTVVFEKDYSKTEIETPPIVIDKKLYLPIRTVTELLGGSVGWIEETKTVTIDTDSERLFLGNRLKISLPIAACCEECIGGKQFYNGSYDLCLIIHDMGDFYIELEVEDLAIKSVGNIIQDLENLRYEICDNLIYKDNNIEVVCVSKDEEDVHFLLKTSDEFLVEIRGKIYFEYETSENYEIAFNKIWNDLICEITEGEKSVDLGPKVVKYIKDVYTGYTFDVPEGYLVYSEWGEVGHTLIIEMPNMSNNRKTPRLVIGYEYGASVGDVVIRQIESEFLDMDVTWDCYANGVAGLTESGINWVRIENSDEAQTNEFIKIVESVRHGD